MCPSYLATRDEKDSTRGRARVLQEMVDGTLVPTAGAPEVHEALDLCLSCKGCARDCPTGVDMATYKAEVLHQTYRRPAPPAQPLHPRAGCRAGSAGRRRRRWPTTWARPGRRPPLAKRAAGVDQRRRSRCPRRRPLRSAEARAGGVRTHDGPDVVLWVDTFTDRFTPERAEAAVAGARARRAARSGVVASARAAG